MKSSDDWLNIVGGDEQVWTQTFAWVAEVVLAGYSGAVTRCTAGGRTAMSSNLAELAAGLRALATADAVLKSILIAHMRLVDNFVKAFYLPSDEELLRWVELHTEYNRAQLTALALSVANFRKLKSKERTVLLDRVQNALRCSGHGDGN